MRSTQGSSFRGSPVNRLRQEMDRVVNEVFAPMANEVNSWFQPGTSGPRLNVWEENDTFYAEAEVPGLRHEDLDVSVVGKQLTIKGRREAAQENKDAVFHRRERTVGEFVRAVTLPADVDADKVSATLAGGVLTVTLPKAEAAKPRKISVQS
jgi:HSP20 family protein